jgi:hypothetical protein
VRSCTLKKTPSLISVLGPDSLAGDMMVDGVIPPLIIIRRRRVAVLLTQPLVLSGLATERALW